MEHRQRVNEHVVRSEAPEIDQRLGVGAEILVGEHRPFRAPGRAGGIENRGEIVGRAGNRRQLPRRRVDAGGERAVAGDAEALHRLEAQSGAQRPNRLQRGRAADRQRRPGVGEEIFQLGQRVGGIERQQRRAGAKTGEAEHDSVRRLVDLRRHPVARLDAEIDQRLRRPAGAGEQLRIVPGDAARALQRDGFGPPDSALQDIEQIGGSRMRHRRLGLVII